MPVTAIAVVLIIMLHGSVSERVVGIEISLVLLVGWGLVLGSSGKVVHHTRPQSNYRMITISEYACLTLALVSLLFVNGYMRPVLFFPFMVGFYFLLLSKVVVSTRLSTNLLFLELIIGQIIFTESFALLYPGFVAVDSYRDLTISQSIVNNAGGLPKNFGAVPWYDFSPTAPLLYAVGSIISSVPLRLMELLQGFVFPAVAMISTYLIAKRTTPDPRVAKTALLISSLLPFLWIWASWPIPETLGLVFVCLSLALSLQGDTSKGIPGLVFLVVATGLTHGGMVVILALLLFTLYMASRSRHILSASFIAILVFLVYSVFVYVQGAQSGIITIWDALLSALTPSGLGFVAPSIGQGGIVGIVESLVGTYWWVFFSTFAWVGFLQLLNKNSVFICRKTVTYLTLIGAIFFSTYFTSAIVATQGSIGRYVGLVGLVLLSVPVSLGLVSLMEVLHSKRRVILSMLILGFVISGACSPLVSPDFWQGIGQSNYAASNRLIYSTTTEQVAGQLFIGNYDYHYSVTSNYYLEFINAINPHVKFSSLVSISSTGIGYTQLPIGPRPQLILLSYRAIQMSSPQTSSSTNGTLQKYDIIYSNPDSSTAYLFP